MDKNLKYKIEVWVTAILFIVIAFLLFRVEVSADCSFKGIELEDVSPAKCYADFNSKFCPVPKDVECSFDIDVPIWMAIFFNN